MKIYIIVNPEGKTESKSQKGFEKGKQSPTSFPLLKVTGEGLFPVHRVMIME